MSRYSFISNEKSETQKFEALKEKIPYKFNEEKNLKSAVAENDTPPTFDHLETIGDCLINMVVKTSLGIANPNRSSGDITIRSQRFLQNINRFSNEESILCQIAANIGLKEYFGNRRLYKDSQGLAHTYASAVEALVGAVFYDANHNLEIVRIFVLKLYRPFGLTDQQQQDNQISSKDHDTPVKLSPT